MFKFIFYFIGVLFLFYKLGFLINPVEKLKNIRKIKQIGKFDWKNIDWKDEIVKEFVLNGMASVCFIIWCFIGLFTFNWILFLGFILLNILILSPLYRYMKDGILFVILHWINSLFGALLCLFTLINSYHLKIDMFNIIKNWF